MSGHIVEIRAHGMVGAARQRPDDGANGVRPKVHRADMGAHVREGPGGGLADALGGAALSGGKTDHSQGDRGVARRGAKVGG